MKEWLFALILLLAAGPVLSQQDSVHITKSQILVLRDSVIIPTNDTVLILPAGAKYRIKPNPYQKSSDFYRKLQNKSEKNRIAKELYDLLVRDSTNNPLDNRKAIKSEEYFLDFDGYEISSISIRHVQMITGSVSDTLKRSDSRIIRNIDKSHRKTRSQIILNNLLFREGNHLNPFLMADSERILRQYSFINDARIYVLPSLQQGEKKVEVIIVIQDRFPWTGNIGFSSFSKFNFTLGQQNIQGTGNEVFAGYYRNTDDQPVNGYSAGYISAPIGNTFARTQVLIEKNYEREIEGITIDKPFLSPAINWGGLFNFFNVIRQARFNVGDSTYETNYELNIGDIWIARAWQPFTNDRKSITLGARTVITSFKNRPEVQNDSNSIFHDRNSYLAAIDYHKSNFVKTSNVQSIGITEDLPVGYSYGATLGGNFTEFVDEWYLGLRFQWNDFRDFGYLSLHSEIGGFRNKSDWTDGVWDSDVGYMSPLIPLGLSTFRLFVNLKYVRSLNLSLPLSIKLGDFIDGLKGFYTNGDNVFAISVEPVWFTHWYWYGFRFAPFARLEVGHVREDRIEDGYSETYPALGGGFRITNPGLILSSLSVSAKVFTNKPPEGSIFYFDISLSARIPFRLNRSEVPVILPYSEYNYLEQN